MITKVAETVPETCPWFLCKHRAHVEQPWVSGSPWVLSMLEGEILRSNLVVITGDLGGLVAKIFLLLCCDSNKLIFILQKV